MNIIGLASETYDADGAAILSPLADTNIRGGDKRISRSKTLDGGVVITDSGHSDGDRTFDIVINAETSLWDTLWLLYQNAAYVTVSTDEGCFKGAIQSISDAGASYKIKIMIKEKLTT